MHALQLPCMCMLQVLHFRIVMEEYQRMLQGIMVELSSSSSSSSRQEHHGRGSGSVIQVPLGC